MVKLTAKEFQEKHNRRLKASLDDVRSGVQKVTENPAEKAIQKKDKMKARLIESIDDGRWENGLKKVSLEQWKDDMLNKGVNRISAGIDGAEQKMIAFGEKLLPHVQQGQDKIKNMPDMTIEDSINRQAEFTRHMHKLRTK